MTRVNRYIFACIFLVGAIVMTVGFRAGKRSAHEGMVWVDNIPILYAPIFYNEDSLTTYIERAYRTDDPEAMCIAGTAAYNLRVFDKAAFDTLPAIPLEDADVMLLRSAWLGYQPAFTIIHFLDQLDLWCHSIPSNTPTIIPAEPAADDPDYVQMIVK